MAKQKPTHCRHGHTIEDHPKCFSRFWYDQPGERLGYLDIETTAFGADEGWMLSWAIKPIDRQEIQFDYVDPDDIFPSGIGKVNENFDYRIVESLLGEMENYTGFVTFYGTGFDIKYIRAKAMRYGMRFPYYGEKGHIDLYYQVASKLKLTHSSLATSTHWLKIEGKTPLGLRYWKLASMGDTEAMKKLVVHNKGDVMILQKEHKKLEPYCKFDRKSL